MASNMKEILKQIIIDFHAEPLPSPLPRSIELPELPKSLRKAFAFVGMRRSGKTWYLYQEMHGLLKRNLDFKKILYINFEDDRLLGLNHDFQSVLDAYFELYPEQSGAEDLQFFFDEIHEIEGWEKFIRRLLDKEKMQLYLSGSSAKMLSKEIATSLRGRTLTREIFPFSFIEYLQAKGIEYTGHLSSKQISTIQYHLEHYRKFGGFPESLDASESLHRELLQGYIDVVIYRDIVERYKISNIVAVKQLIKFCIQNSASSISINKIYKYFKSKGFSVGKDSLYAFMSYFQDAYCIFSIPLYSFSLKKSELNPKKIYPVDPGLITALSIKSKFDDSARLESLIFMHLRRQTEEIYYYETKQGKEVDFLVLLDNEKINLYQVCLSLSNEETRKREITALQQAMEELNVKEGTIVTVNEEETIEQGSTGLIQIVQAWRFLLS